MTCISPQWIWLRKSYPIEKPQFEETMHILNKPKWRKHNNYYAKAIPCHQCLGCLLDHASEWAVRSYMEYKTTQIGCFITLTYNGGFSTIKGQENEISMKFTKKGQETYNRLIKKYKHADVMKYLNALQNKHRDYFTLHKPDLQKFWKRLRKKYPDCKIKYMASGEIGPTNGRPHFHAVVFGWQPDDLEYYKTNKNGDKVFKSHTLQKIWGLGFCTIGELNYKTACYTARYTQKKLIKEHKNHLYYDNILKEEKPKYDIIAEKKYKIEEIAEITADISKALNIPYNKNSILKYFTDLNTKKKKIKYNRDIQEEFITSSQKIGLKYWIINKKLIKSDYGILVNIDGKPKIKKIPSYFLKLWEKENWEEYETAKYKNQLRGEKLYWQTINNLNYPQGTPDFLKEIIFKQKQIDKLNSAVQRLHRDNINEKNYYSS